MTNELIDRLRAADPAADLPALPEHDRDLLLRVATATPPRGALLPVARALIAAAVPVAAVAAVVAVLPAPGPTQAPAGKIGATAPLVLTLAPDDPTAICLPVADIPPGALRDSDVAFSGVVVAIDGDEVVVTPDRFFRGTAASEVRLRTGSPALDGTAFRADERVLVAATDGSVLGCGLSGEDSTALRDVWDRAFPS